MAVELMIDFELLFWVFAPIFAWLQQVVIFSHYRKALWMHQIQLFSRQCILMIEGWATLRLAHWVLLTYKARTAFGAAWHGWRDLLLFESFRTQISILRISSKHCPCKKLMKNFAFFATFDISSRSLMRDWLCNVEMITKACFCNSQLRPVFKMMLIWSPSQPIELGPRGILPIRVRIGQHQFENSSEELEDHFLFLAAFLLLDIYLRLPHSRVMLQIFNNLWYSYFRFFFEAFVRCVWCPEHSFSFYITHHFIHLII